MEEFQGEEGLELEGNFSMKGLESVDDDTCCLIVS